MDKASTIDKPVKACLNIKNDSKPIVLVVDDTPVNIDILLDSLSHDYDVRVASEGEEALALLQKLVPDIILLDVMMPEMDGFEVCRHIKRDERLHGIPVIFLTARTSADDKLRGFDYGAVDYLTKPFDVGELKARVSVHIELKRSRELIQRQNSEHKELLHVLCHDLANPLSNNQTAVSLTKEEHDPRLQKEYLDLMEKSVRHGLDVTRIIRSMLTIEDKPLLLTSVNLRQTIEDSISVLYHMVARKSIALKVDISRAHHVFAERTTLLNSVINNILTNAIKFSYNGATISMTSSEEDNSSSLAQTILLEITDQGIGMSQNILDNIFDIGKSISREGTAGETGTGFGMPLVRKFMHAYGGDIAIQSRSKDDHPDNHGTTIQLRFKSV